MVRISMISGCLGTIALLWLCGWSRTTNERTIFNLFDKEMKKKERFTILIGMATTEVNLIWLRYSAFLVAAGLDLAAIPEIAEKDLSLRLSLCVFGYVVSVTWWLINFAGWINQNLWYRKAHEILPNTTITSWTTRLKRWPSGPIYKLAQVMPG